MKQLSHKRQSVIKTSREKKKKTQYLTFVFLFTETNEEIFKQPLLYTMGRKHFVLKQKAHSCLGD